MYTHAEVLQILKAARARPTLWQRMKTGAFVGGVLAAMAAGYKDDEIMSYLERKVDPHTAKKLALGVGIGAAAGAIAKIKGKFRRGH